MNCDRLPSPFRDELFLNACIGRFLWGAGAVWVNVLPSFGVILFVIVIVNDPPQP